MCIFVVLFVFFYKQKTAYEMRISDWSSDVCSSDLAYIPERRVQRDRWVQAMQRDQVPLRVIDGAVDPISGEHMVARYEALIPNPDTVLLPDIGHYPQIGRASCRERVCQYV